jgi:hypothetical protein
MKRMLPCPKLALLAALLVVSTNASAQTSSWSGPPSSFTRMKYSRDYPTGTFDTNGGFLGGTACMYLVPHDGRLWAGIGYWNDIPGSDPAPGPQIVVKFVHDPALSIPPGTGIGHMGIRSIAPSPFEGEAGRVFYFGGGDAGGPTPWLHNTAWIYRGTLPDDRTPFSISGTTATLTLETTAGWNAQIQTSTDLIVWTNQGSAFVGNNAPRTVNQNISGQPRRFYRVLHTRTTP